MSVAALSLEGKAILLRLLLQVRTSARLHREGRLVADGTSVAWCGCVTQDLEQHKASAAEWRSQGSRASTTSRYGSEAAMTPTFVMYTGRRWGLTQQLGLLDVLGCVRRCGRSR